MKYRYFCKFLIVLLTLVSLLPENQLSAQYQQLLDKTYAQRLEFLWDFHTQTWYMKDSIANKARIKSLKEFAIAHWDKELSIEADFSDILYRFQKNAISTEAAIKETKQLIDATNKIGYTIALPKFYRQVAYWYWHHMYNYEMAFEYQYMILDIQEKFTDEESPDKPACYAELGEYYFFINNYTLCKQIMKKVLAFPPNIFTNKIQHWARNAIGLSFQAEGKLDSADKYFNEIIHSEIKYRLVEWAAISKGNLAYSHFLRGDYEKSIPLFKEDIETALKFADYGLASTSSARLGESYFKLGKYDEAETQAQLALNYALESGQYKRLEPVYTLLTKIALHQRNFKKIESYHSATIIVKDSLKKLFNANQLLRVHQKFQRLNELKFENKQRESRLERNFLIAFVFTLMILSVYVYFNQRNKFKQNQIINQLKLDQVEQDLENSSIQLQQFAQGISDKTKIIEEMEIQLEKELNYDSVLELQHFTILTDEDWDKFRILFEAVHKGFLISLKEKFPTLSPAEIRFMSLSKLKLNNKEIANSLGISVQSIRVTRHRIFKKINLPKESSFEDLVEQI